MINFDSWFDIFVDKVHKLGYNGPIDKDSFEDEFNDGKSPEESAASFVKEMMD